MIILFAGVWGLLLAFLATGITVVVQKIRRQRSEIGGQSTSASSVMKTFVIWFALLFLIMIFVVGIAFSRAKTL